jgi:hypothetical protein
MAKSRENLKDYLDKSSIHRCPHLRLEKEAKKERDNESKDAKQSF